jgi:hypothetical protein
MWADDVSADVEETFSALGGCFDVRTDWSHMHSGSPKDVGIRVRRIGRDTVRQRALRVVWNENNREQINARKRELYQANIETARAQMNARKRASRARKKSGLLLATA